MHCGCFIGLSTYDIIYEVEKFPDINEKIVAKEQLNFSGGPATNAAITFSLLGGKSTLLSVLGQYAISDLIRGEIDSFGVKHLDLNSKSTTPPAFSSIIVQKKTGDRAVVSVNAIKSKSVLHPKSKFNVNEWNIVLADGHQIEVSKQVCALAKEENIPCVFDGGSWKPGTEELLPFIDYSICSEDFFPPGCSSTHEVFDYLHQQGIRNAAITRGAKAIIVSVEVDEGQIAVPRLSLVSSTLGAGDILHGAFCYFILIEKDFSLAIEKAARIATISCRYKDTRQWAEDTEMQEILTVEN